MKEEGAQRRWKGGGAEEVREAGPYHLSVWYWCSLLQLSVLHRMSGECHQVPPSGAPPPKGTTPDPPRAHPGPTPSKHPHATPHQPLVIRPLAPYLSSQLFCYPPLLGYPFYPYDWLVGGTQRPAPWRLQVVSLPCPR